MSESKYGKYIVTELKAAITPAPWSTQPKPVQLDGKGPGGRLLWLDNEVIPGAFYVETAWSFPRKIVEPSRVPSQSHKHDFDEVLCMVGTNRDDPYDLGGEVEFWMGDEKHTITKSCMIFIPKGLQHCPLTYVRVDRPIFNFTTFAGKMYF